MGRTETIPDVPNADLERVKRQFEAAGATVVVSDNDDGTSTLVATFPNGQQ
jgi:hypothetical protein